MTGFNYASARDARARNTRLTEFDTGEILQPVLDPRPEERGHVDFDNDESQTVLRVRAQPSSTESNTTVLQVTTFGDRVALERDGKLVWCEEPAVAQVLGGNAVRVDVPSAEWDVSESTYVDIEGLTTILNAWAAGDLRRSWVQTGEGYDAIVALTWWDSVTGEQKLDVQDFAHDAADAIGFGWSLTGLPFSVELEPTLRPDPVIVADMDGTDDAADWIQPGHVISPYEAKYLRGLVLPSAYERITKD